MSRLLALAAETPARGHRPWPRGEVDAAGWTAAGEALAAGSFELLGLWGERDAVHMALREPQADVIAVLTLACPHGEHPSIGRMHPPAIRLERAAQDLHGLRAVGLPDRRPWLDHGRWRRDSVGEAEEASSEAAAGYPFLPVEGESLHQIPVGPVHAGIIEPGHFRFTAQGETVVRLEQRLGYVHKGVEALMVGADAARMVALAGRISGDATVAHALAAARAVEAASAAEVPARGHWLRALMAEIERVANHLGDIGAICNDAAFALMQAHCSALREQALRAAHSAFGHRMMRDCVVVGGVAAEPASGGLDAVRALVALVRARFPALVELYDETASLQDRTVGTGVVGEALVRQFAAGGFVGRASGRGFDARRDSPYPPYDALGVEVPIRAEGDVDARVWIRIREVEASLALLDRLIDELPGGPSRVAVPARGGEGMALVESFRGDVLAWVRLGAGGRVERCHLRDPSWFQWPLLEAAIEGNIVADFPLCNKSFNCSYSGHDL
ncbi:MAG: nickel-dependent hydrogenase large subunit [Ectothiorhodospiraceae bacterium]|nr:nickel-dependent hydrogenase large subunit [Chromatiales bacterium]MCP5154659.1 nickel-dependent hydrogenase large subunit [Ectothiorhodospiraceae bacterium]